MNPVLVALAGIKKYIQEHELSRYLTIGWERVDGTKEQPQASTPEASPKPKAKRTKKVTK